MATPPFLVESGGEYRLDVALGQAGRERFGLSDRATALLVDDLGYGNRDVVPWVTARSLVLTGSASRRTEKTDARETTWSISGADGGREATDAELERVADYLSSVEIDHHAVETAREHVRTTQLSKYVSPDALQGTRERTQGLRDIAKDL